MKNLYLFLFFWSPFLHSQNEVPQHYFDNPMQIPLVLSGNFGELRSNHFHSGLDIKTQQVEGIPVYAIGDGYISRIKVSEYGYGKALYIQHGNGYSSVYAHLKSYAGALEDYVKENQYKKESYEIELFPESTLLPIKKGDLIAYTGNTGSSGGPHLHFEIRDSSSRPINPMLFGIEIPDTRPPLIDGLFAYPISEDAIINGSPNPIKVRLTQKADGSFTAENVKAIGKIGFGVTANDQQNGASNKNGVYRLKASFNGESKFEVTFNKFSFDETRYLNRYIDYEYFETNKSRIQKLFRQSNNPLSVITQENDYGYLEMQEGLSGVYVIDIEDFKGNQVNISVPIEGIVQELSEPKLRKETPDYVYCEQATSFTKGKYSIYIPAGSLYEDTYLSIEAKGDTLDLHQDIIPIHNNITISVDVSNYRTEDLEKLYIGRINFKGSPYYNSTTRDGDKLSSRIRTFGSYCIAMDTIAPKINPINFENGKWISNNKTLQIKIQDKESGISTYRATLNGKFILMEYEYKKNLLTYDFNDGIVSDSENNLKLIVVDNVGNNTTFEATFFRKSL